MSGEEGTFQMLWGCEYCDTQKLLAVTHKHCPVCGAAQSVSRRYYPEPGDEVAVEDHEFTGADLACGGCDAPNAARAKFCGSCGSDLEGAQPVSTRSSQEAAEGEAFAKDSSKRARAEHRAQKLDREAAQKMGMSGQVVPSQASKNGGLRWVGALAFIALSFVLMGVLCFGFSGLLQKEVSVDAVDHEWSRTIVLEEYRTVRERAWRENRPSNGRVVTCADKIQSHKQVRDGETCKTVRQDKGDGTFTKKQKCSPKFRKEPVMGVWCTFELERWKSFDTVSSSGGLTDERKWPSVSLVKTGLCVGCQRTGAREEVLTVVFKDNEDGAEYRADCTEVQWRSVTIGQRYQATGWKGSTSLDCASLNLID